MNEEHPDQGIEGQSQDLDAERSRAADTPDDGELRPAAEATGRSPGGGARRGARGGARAAQGYPGRGQRGHAVTTTRVRLDTELVRRGLARSREQAGELVAAGRVTVAGLRAAKAATQVSRDAPISIADTGEPGYVSRGGRKLAGALAVFGPGGLTVAGRACLDAGASTG